MFFDIQMAPNSRSQPMVAKGTLRGDGTEVPSERVID